MHEHIIKRIYNHKGQRSLSDLLYKYRMGKGKTDWMPQEVGDQLEDKWSGTTWQKKSEQVGLNRVVDSGASSYTGGCVSAAEHRRRFVST